MFRSINSDRAGRCESFKASESFRANFAAKRSGKKKLDFKVKQILKETSINIQVQVKGQKKDFWMSEIYRSLDLSISKYPDLQKL